MITKILQTTIETFVASYLPTLQAHQETFKAAVLRVDEFGFTVKRGYYWQGDTVASKADGSTKGLEAAWPTLPATLPTALRVDPYEGAKGRGWILYAQARDTNGVLCQRAWDIGPEERDQAWREIK